MRTTASARNTDPSTSHQAAGLAEESGMAASHRAMCLAQVTIRPGSTAAEIAVFAGLERHIPSRRLPELRAAGLVTNGLPRTCKETGNRSITWWPTSHKP